MSNVDAVIAALGTGNETLTALVSKLSDDDLALTSGAAEWDLSQVLSHLGSGAVITHAGLDAALAGEPRPDSDFNTGVWDRWNAMSRRDRADAFLEANHALTRAYESLDAEMRENLRIDLGFMPAPVDLATAAGMRLNELTLHGWDLRVVFDPAATLPADATEALLHSEPDMLAWIAKGEQLNGERTVIEVTTDGPESVFALNLNEQVTKSFDVPPQTDGALTLPAESWLRLVAGRLAPDKTPAGVVTTGAADLELLRRVFPGY